MKIKLIGLRKMLDELIGILTCLIVYQYCFLNNQLIYHKRPLFFFSEGDASFNYLFN